MGTDDVAGVHPDGTARVVGAHPHDAPTGIPEQVVHGKEPLDDVGHCSSLERAPFAGSY